MVKVSTLFWDGNKWNKIASPSIFAPVHSFSSFGGEIYVAAGMLMAPGANLVIPKVSKWDGNNWYLLESNNMLYPALDIKTFTDHLNNTYAAGRSEIAGGNIIEKWDGVAWTELGQLMTRYDGPNASVYGGCADNLGRVFLYGHFIDNNNKAFMQYWDGITWQKLGDSSVIGDVRSAIIDQDNNLIISSTKYVSGESIPFILKWDGNNWTQVGDINPLNQLGTLLMSKSGELYCVGTPLTGLYEKHITRLKDNQWEEVGGNQSSPVNNDRRITAVALDSVGNLYAGGYFISQPERKYIARYDSLASPTHIPELVEPDLNFVVSPNPNRGSFMLTIDKELMSCKILLYNLSGKIIFDREFKRTHDANLLFEKYTPGMYFVQVKSGNKVRNQKVVIY